MGGTDAEDIHPLADSFMSLASALSGTAAEGASPPEDLSDSVTRRFHDQLVDPQAQPSTATWDKV